MSDQRAPAGAALADLRDETPYGARSPALAPRIGWLLRSARLTADRGGEVSRNELIERLDDLGVTAGRTRVFRAETGERDSEVIRAYERALGLHPAQLLSVVDNLCDGFTTAAPDKAAKRTNQRPPDVAAVSRAVEPLLRADGALTADEWVTLGSHVRHEYARGIPLPMLEPAIDRLLPELAVSISYGSMARYWTLCQLAAGPYGDVVLERVQGFLAHPGAQRIYNIVSAVTSQPRPGVLRWLTELVEDHREPMRIAAAQGLLYHHASHPITDWSRIAPATARALAEADPSGEAHRWLVHLVRAFPREVPERRVIEHLPDPRADVHSEGTDGSVDARWQVAQEMTDRICAHAGVQPQQVMTRMLHEVLYDGRPVRRDTSLEILGAVPFRDLIFEELLAHGFAQPNDARRARVFTMLADWDWAPASSAAIEGWRPEPGAAAERARTAVRTAAGLALEPETILRMRAAGGYEGRWIVRLAGMSGDPVLRTWASGDDRELADASRWWLEFGPQLTE